mmetsp:Transcript_96323/g.272367  ORF Transcript_96323/g.272367 Transcript_96323/m.272367 type:complete len:430 (-) Transcript_96323:3-1292(-)
MEPWRSGSLNCSASYPFSSGACWPHPSVSNRDPVTDPRVDTLLHPQESRHVMYPDMGMAHGVGHKLLVLHRMLMLITAMRLRGVNISLVQPDFIVPGTMGEHVDMYRARKELQALFGGAGMGIPSLSALPEGVYRRALIGPFADGHCRAEVKAGPRLPPPMTFEGVTHRILREAAAGGSVAFIVCCHFSGKTWPNTDDLALPGYRWMRSALATSGLRPPWPPRPTLRVAVHIRRGDVLLRQQERMFRHATYVSVVASLLRMLVDTCDVTNLRIETVVFSETWPGQACHKQHMLCSTRGRGVDFAADVRASLGSRAAAFGSLRISTKLNSNTALVFLGMVTSDVLVVSNSGFSAAAALLGTGVVLLPSEGKKHSGYIPEMLAKAADPVVVPPYRTKTKFEASLMRAALGLQTLLACMAHGRRELVVDPGL